MDVHLAVLIILLHNLSAATFATISRKLAPMVPNAYFQVNTIIFGFIAVAGLLTGLALGGVQTDPLGRWLPWLIGGGLAFALSNVLQFKVFQYVDAAIGTLLSTFSIVVTVVASTIVLNEGLSLQTGLGAVMIVGAAWIVLSARVSDVLRHKWLIGVALSVVASIILGLAIVNEKFLLNHMNMSSYLVWGWSFQFAMAAICGQLFYQRRGWAELKAKRPFMLVSMAGLIRAAGGICFVSALVIVNNVSVVTTLSGLKIILAALFGLLFLGESQFMTRKLGAALLAAVGVAVMFW